MTSASPFVLLPQFPSHSQPRVWLITSAASPIGIAVARQVLSHGDNVVAGVKSSEISEENNAKGEIFARFLEEIVTEKWDDKCLTVELDERCEVSSQIINCTK